MIEIIDFSLKRRSFFNLKPANINLLGNLLLTNLNNQTC